MNANNPEKANAEYKAGNGAPGGGRRQGRHHGFRWRKSGQLVRVVQVFPFLSYFLLSLKIRKRNSCNIVNKLFL